MQPHRHASAHSLSPNSCASRSTCRNLIYVRPQPVSPTATGLRVGLFNAQSAGSAEKRAEISTFIHDYSVDLLFLTETWFKSCGDEAKIAELAPSGYAARSFPRPSRGGGLAVIYKNSLATHLTFKSDFNFNHVSFELVQVSVTLQYTALHFVCLYRPPPNHKNKLTDSMFLEQFPDLLDMCNSLHGQLCILGDINIHYDCPNSPLTAKTLDILQMYNLKQMVTEPTHRRGHTIDWVLVRPDEQVHRSSNVSDSLESDHFCVMSVFDVTVANSSPVYQSVRNIRSIDRTAFVADLEAELAGMCDSLSADQYNAILRSVLDNHAPASMRKVTHRVSSPWFGLVGDELLEAKRNRRQAERKWRSTGLSVFKDIYQKAKHYVTKIVLKAKTQYYNLKISSAHTSKELYKITNSILSRTKSIHLPTSLPLSSLPDLFSTFFTEKIMKIRRDLDSQAVHSPLSQSDSFAGVPFSTFQPVSEATVKDVIMKSSPKTCSLDPIPTPLLLESLDALLPSLTAIINSSLSSGTFPQVFKTALVSPLLKKQHLDQNELKNYRPVSNLPFI